MYESTDTRKPLYSWPHFNFTTTALPVRSAKKGLGFLIDWETRNDSEQRGASEQAEWRAREWASPMPRRSVIQQKNVPQPFLRDNGKIKSPTTELWQLEEEATPPQALGLW